MLTVAEPAWASESVLASRSAERAEEAGGGIALFQHITRFPLVATVKPLPGVLTRYLWVIVGVAIFLILGILLAFVRRRARRAADVRGLYVIIRRIGEQVGSELRAPSKQAQTFRFVIRDEGESTERLDYPRPEDPVYTVRRGKDDQVNVVGPTGDRYDIIVGSTGRTLPSGLRLVFQDLRHARSSPRSAVGRDIALGRTLTPPTADPGHGASPPPSTSDPWLT